MKVSPSRMIPAGLTFVISLVVYLKTSFPTVTFIDSGELAVVCNTLGIAHPTGYPLYVLAGRIFSWLSFGSAITMLNVFSAATISLATFFFYLSAANLLKDSTKEPGLLSRLGLAGMSLFFAFTPLIWSQGTTNEVYGLHLLFLVLTFYLTLKWYAKSSNVLPFLLAYVFGLGFTNHMTTILLLPSLALLFLLRRKDFPLRLGRILLLGGLFILGFSLYLYLPIRSATGPLMDWSHPANWHNFKQHLTGWQYQVWMFSGDKSELLEHLTNYGKILLEQFPLPLLPFSLIGLVWLLLKQFRTGAFLFLLIIATIIYGINYRIGDVETYYLASFLAIGMSLALGTWLTVNWITTKVFRRSIQLAEIIFLTAAVGLMVWGVSKNYQEQNRSQNYFAYDITENISKSVKAPAMVITDIWDYYSPSLYQRIVKNNNRDVIYLDKELMRRSWYYRYLKLAYPDVYKKSLTEIDQFIDAVYPFEHFQQYDSDNLDLKFQALLQSLVETNMKSRKVYLLLANPEPAFEKLLLIPEGLGFRVVDSLNYYPYIWPKLQFRGLTEGNVYKDGRTRFQLGLYPRMLEARAQFEAFFGFDSLEIDLKEKARQLRALIDE